MLQEDYSPIQLKAQHSDMEHALKWLNLQLTPRVDEQTLARTMVLIEELYTNTIDHGYRWECDEPVVVGYKRQAGELHLYFADKAPAFDPRTLNSPSGRDIGGNGLFLIRKLPKSVDYQFKDGWNRVLLVLEAQ